MLNSNPPSDSSYIGASWWTNSSLPRILQYNATEPDEERDESSQQEAKHPVLDAMAQDRDAVVLAVVSPEL